MQISIKACLWTMLGMTVAIVAALGVLSHRSLVAAGYGLRQLLATTEIVSRHQTGDMMHDAIRGDVMAALVAEGPGEWREVGIAFEAHVREFRAVVAANAGASVDAAMRESFAEAARGIEAYVAAASSVIEAARTDKARARALYPAFAAKFGELEESLGAITEQLTSVARSSREDEQRLIDRALRIGLAVGAGACALALLLALWVARRIRGGIAALVGTVRQIQATHDLARRVPPGGTGEIDELAYCFNGYLGEMNEVIAEVQQGATAIKQRADQVSLASDVLASGATSQAASIEQVTA